MLEFASRAGYEPGTNLRGEQAQTAWLFLLPRLDLDCALLVGLPALGTVVAVAGLAGEVVVGCPRRSQLQRARRVAAERQLANVRAVALEPDDPRWPAADLVYLTARELPGLARSARALGELEARLSAGAAIYLEPAPLGIELIERLGASVAVVMGVAGSPERGQRPDGDVAAWLVPADRNGNATRPGQALREGTRRAGRIVTRVAGGRSGRIASAPAALGVTRVSGPPLRRLQATTTSPPGVLARPLTGAPEGAPEYLLAAAREAGHPLDDRPWRLAAPRGYRSQKVIFLVGDEDVVKLTQDPRFNARLDNEFHALGLLRERGLEAAVAAPRALFRAEHARLSIVGETRLAGRPFRECSSAEPDCEHAAAAIAAISALGAASARREPPDGRSPAAPLLDLLARYAEIYRPGGEQRGMLDEAVGALVDAGAELPSVFLHGDPTTLNLLVDDDGTIGMVDWENAESAGPPLWDLFYFLQAYRGWAAARLGRRYTPAAFGRELCDPSAFGGLPARAVESYRRALGLQPTLVGPLFCTCWMYLALRQSRQLAPRSLGRGLYTGILDGVAARRGARWPWPS
jgi:hypothetical protein